MLGLLCLLVGLPVVHHQLFELIEIIEAQQHIQQLVIDLLSTRLQQLVETDHIAVLYELLNTLNWLFQYLFDIGLHFRLVGFEDRRVLEFILFSGFELPAVTSDEVRVYFFKLGTDDYFLDGSHDSVEVVVVWVGVGCIEHAFYRSRTAQSPAGRPSQVRVAPALNRLVGWNKNGYLIGSSQV